jgi:membrane protein
MNIRKIEFFHFIEFVYQNFTRHKGLENAKSLTYMSLFAVIPLLTVLVTILSAFPAFQVFGNQVQSMVLDRLLPSSSSELENYFTGFSEQAKNLTWVGAMMLLVTSFLMLLNIESSFNRIWEVRESRKGLNSFLLYWSVMSLGPILLGLGFAISSYITSLNLFDSFLDISEYLGTTSILLGVFPLFLTTGAFTLLYIAVPNCGVRFHHGVIGGLVVALSFLVVRQVFTWFISLASYQLVYGTFAAVPIFLLWVYICWVVILVGANLVRSLPAYSTEYKSGNVHPYIIMIALLHKFWLLQKEGESLSMSDLINEKWPFNELSMADALKVLQENRIIRNCGSDEFVVVRDFKDLSVQEIFSWLNFSQPKAKDFESLPSLIADHLPQIEKLKSSFAGLENATQKEFAGPLTDIYMSK